MRGAAPATSSRPATATGKRPKPHPTTRAALARAALGLHQVGAATWSSHADVIALLRQAIAARAEQDATTARLLAALARELAHGPGARSEALAVSSRAVALAERIGDPAVLAIGLQARHDALWAPGSARQRLDVLADMQRAAAAAADPVMAWEALFGQFVALLELGDPEAYSVFFQVVEATDRLGQPHYRWVMQSRRAVLAIFAGRLEEAEALLPQIAETGQRLGEPDGMNVVGDLMWQLAALRGTRRMLRDSWAVVADRIPPVMRAMVEGLAALDDGDPESGLAAVRPWVEPALDGVRGWQVLGNAAMLAELAAAAGDEALCRRLYDRLAPHAGEIVVTGGAANVAGPVSLYLGLLASRLGRRADAVAHLRHAVEASERLDARPWAARARQELACLPRYGLPARGRRPAVPAGPASPGRPPRPPPRPPPHPRPACLGRSPRVPCRERLHLPAGRVDARLRRVGRPPARREGPARHRPTARGARPRRPRDRTAGRGRGGGRGDGRRRGPRRARPSVPTGGGWNRCRSSSTPRTRPATRPAAHGLSPNGTRWSPRSRVRVAWADGLAGSGTRGSARARLSRHASGTA